MGPKNESDKVKLGTVIDLNDTAKETFTNTFEPPEKRRRRLLPMQDTIHVANDASQTAIESERVRPEAQLDAKTGMSTNTLTSLGTLISDTEPKLTAQIDKFGETLRRELDAARIAIQDRETEYAIKLAKVKDVFVSVEGERDAAMRKLAEQQAHAKIERDNKLQLENKLTALECEKRKVQRNLSLRREDVEHLRKSEQALKKELEEARCDCERVRSHYVGQLNERQKELSLVSEEKTRLTSSLERICKGLEEELSHVREEKTQLTSSLERICKDLDEEKEKSVCQICLESPKDSMCFPCLHFHYCFVCLDRHRRQSNTCPSCRAIIQGVLNCNKCI